MEKSRRYGSRSASNQCFSYEKPSNEPTYIGASCDEARSRKKKSAHEHPAAKSCLKELMRTPNEVSQMPKKVDPGKLAASGVCTTRLTEIKRSDHVTCVENIVGKSAAFSGCRIKQTDPITHRRPSCNAQCLVESELDGAAGQSSTRLTNLQSNWLKPGPGRPDFKPPPRGRYKDLIVHSGDRGRDAVTQGLRGFPGRNTSNIPMEHLDKEPFTPQSQQEIQGRGGSRKQKEIPLVDGTLRMNLGGDHDTLPVATKRYAKQDTKYSRSPESYKNRFNE